MEYLSKQNVAEKFGVSVQTIDNWRRHEGLPSFKLGTLVKFVEADIDAWAEERRVDLT
jgi:excisionase family DNA binding protein